MRTRRWLDFRHVFSLIRPRLPLKLNPARTFSLAFAEPQNNALYSASRLDSMASSIINKSASVTKPIRLTRFIESVRVKFQGGRGGDGCISMLSIFANEFAGPDGGNGGCGGHVVLRANQQVKSLAGVQKAYHGLPGGPGLGKNLYGANARHIFVDVPVGTIVTPSKPKELSEHEFDPEKSDIVAELDQHGSHFIAARGGAGGKGNAYYLSNKNRHPRCAERGASGEINIYDIRMRLYAHLGLIGMPNAGKSTLLKRMTKANVKIGEYAFTTLYPQVGVISFPDYTQIAIADLPGLIEDSHKNRGLGITFLRHVRRCVSLLYVLDLTNNPIKQFETLIKELDLYKQGMSRMPHMVLANKIDVEGSTSVLQDLLQYMAVHRPETKVMTISSLRGDNLDSLKHQMRLMYDNSVACIDDSDGALIW